MTTDFQVKVRLHDNRQWKFLGTAGRLTGLRVHALAFEHGDEASLWAERTLAQNAEQVAATRVVRDGRTVVSFGAPTPPKPAPPDLSGYRYLVAIRKDRGTFHVKNDDGSWGRVDVWIYELCRREAKRAGLDTKHMTIHGSICTYQPMDWRGFVQRSDRNPTWRG